MASPGPSTWTSVPTRTSRRPLMTNPSSCPAWRWSASSELDAPPTSYVTNRKSMLPRDAVVRRSQTTPDARRIAWRVAARWTGTSGSTSSPAPPSPARRRRTPRRTTRLRSRFEEEQLVERQAELGDDGIERVHGRSRTARLDLGDEARRDLEALGQPADAQAAGEASRSEAVAHRGIAGPRFLIASTCQRLSSVACSTSSYGTGSGRRLVPTRGHRRVPSLNGRPVA